ncbi:type 2 isopentenyl-diphosphate Delta-isomerase [Spirochaeta dissipatitropha]
MSNEADRDLGLRKAQHLDICIDEEQYNVEGGNTRFSEVHFRHKPLPELMVDQVDSSMSFFGQQVRLPFFISSMTGGSEHGYALNKKLAQAAQEAGIAVGMGSIRILFRKPEVFDHFYLRKIAPDVPIFANLGGVQLRDMNGQEISEMLKRLEVSALAVHLNPGQELFQSDGDRDFRGVLDGIARFVEISPVPVIVKETGFGIDPDSAARLWDAGVEYVNIAGSGGTNWISVESYREDPALKNAADEFHTWGTPTALILEALRSGKTAKHKILSSGGLRSGMDVAKSIAMGAEAAGFALPFIRAVHKDGVEGALNIIRHVGTVLHSAMVLSGSQNLEEFRNNRIWVSETLASDARAYLAN